MSLKKLLQTGGYKKSKRLNPPPINNSVVFIA